MKNRFSITVLFLLITVLLNTSAYAKESLLVFAGAASQPPSEEAAMAFAKKYGIEVNINFGGSGYVLSQMILGRQGDIYFPGSSDYMEIAKKKEVVIPDTERVVVYLVPAINVRKGNPKNIRTLEDLSGQNLNIAIANPENVCVGAYAVELIEKNLRPVHKNALKNNVLNYAESCSKTASVVSLRMVDAVIGWRVFEHWDPERIESVPLRPSEVARVGYIPIAVSRFSKKPETAQKFIDFIMSDEGKDIFRKYSYFMSPEEAFAWIGESKPVGGEYAVPKEWIRK